MIRPSATVSILLVEILNTLILTKIERFSFNIVGSDIVGLIDMFNKSDETWKVGGWPR